MSSNSGPSSTTCCTPRMMSSFSSTSLTRTSAKRRLQHGGGFQGKRTLPQSPRRCQDRAPVASNKVFHQVRVLVVAPQVVRRGGLPIHRRGMNVVMVWSSTRPSRLSWRFPQKGKTTGWIMPDRHDANESYTIIEQCTAFGNLNIGVSFVVRRKSGVVVPATKFGQSGEESILLGTVSAAVGDNLAHFR